MVKLPNFFQWSMLNPLKAHTTRPIYFRLNGYILTKDFQLKGGITTAVKYNFLLSQIDESINLQNVQKFE